jgi:hypothetical protein
MSGGTRATRKPAALISASVIGSACPVSETRLRRIVRNAPTSTTERSSRRHTRKSCSSCSSSLCRRVSNFPIATIRLPSSSGMSG